MSDRWRPGSLGPEEQDDRGAHARPPKRFGGPGKVVAAVVPLVQLARLGLPALVAASGVAVLVLVAACWVLDDDGRAERLALVVAALDGMAGWLLPRPRRARHARPARLTVVRPADDFARGIGASRRAALRTGARFLPYRTGSGPSSSRIVRGGLPWRRPSCVPFTAGTGIS